MIWEANYYNLRITQYQIVRIIEYNMRMFFWINHTQNVVGKLVPDLFLIIQN